MTAPVEIKLVPVGPAVHAAGPETQVSLTPLFYRGERYSIVASLTVLIQGTEYANYVLRMNGKTGELGLVDRTATVEPSIVKKEHMDAPASKAVQGSPVPNPK